MNTTVNPCDDFFQYACGGWIHKNPIPDGELEYGPFIIAGNEVIIKLKELLESNKTITPKCLDMPRILYKKCMSADEREEIETEQLIDMYRKIGSWPLLEEDWDSCTFDITYMLTLIAHTLSNSVLFKFDITADIKNNTINSLYIEQTNFGIGSRVYRRLNRTNFAEYLNAYKEYRLNALKLVLSGANISYNVSQLETAINDVIAFEMEITKFMEPEKNMQHSSSLFYNKRIIADLYTLCPQIDWLKLIFCLVPPSVRDIIDNNTVIIIRNIGYFRNLSNLLGKTSNRIVANCIFLQTIDVWSALLGKAFENNLEKLTDVLNDIKIIIPRWKGCVEVTETLLKHATSALYVRKHFDPDIRKDVMDILEGIREALQDNIAEIDWMDNDTKNAALQKAAAMISKVGYDDMFLNDTALTEYYEKLNITQEDSYFKAVLKIATWEVEKDFLNLKKPFDRYEFFQTASTVNAYHEFLTNAVSVPAAFLTPPFFNRNYPKTANYGSLGAVIGHELTHGFDNSGSLYDMNGNLKNWWSEESYENFKNKTQCFVEQYESFKVPNMEFK
ncbi:unnamed protein product, partial [Cercopithifilaria johnstoni]